MRYNKIRKMDISNGEGIRVSIFVQGCTFNCAGCFNPETHDFNEGKEFTQETLSTLLDLCNNSQIKGLSILGGEPLHSKNVDTVLKIVKQFKQSYPNKDLWLWTGFQFEDILKDINKKLVIEYCDFIIDGRFIENKKDLRLKWAGSTNQRFIDVQQSLKENKIIILKNY